MNMAENQVEWRERSYFATLDILTGSQVGFAGCYQMCLLEAFGDLFGVCSRTQDVVCSISGDLYQEQPLQSLLWRGGATMTLSRLEIKLSCGPTLPKIT
jgi:hypothetical protein